MYRLFLKRTADCAFSLLALLILFPLFLFLAIIIAIVTHSSPFFLQSRPGKKNRIFKLMKFKSMNDKKDAKGNLLADSERLTKIGRFLRATSIDELPQLFNVLKGDMSLIGPRPLFIQYLPFYSQRESTRHLVRPGITGLAQVSGRNNLGWEERLELDVKYVETISLSNDIGILLKTVKYVLIRKDVVVIPGEKREALDKYRNVKLRAKRFKQTDIETRVDWINDARIHTTMYFELPATIEKTKEWYKRNISNGSRSDFTFVDMQSNRVAMGGYTHIDLRNGHAEFHIMVNPIFQGKGIGKKVTRWLLNYAFITYGLNKIYLYTNNDNSAAYCIYEKYNFKLEGILRQHQFKDGSHRDRRFYGLLRTEWDEALWRETHIKWDF
jgi:lipopolysaccharide/colanic/teichoic acid biosynthesis glycosyltransferase/RimJ/RimL family protein N-acetyltransferase